MASIRKRGNSCLLVVSMGYDFAGRRRKALSEATVEGVHACLCGILSDAMEDGYLDHNPAWRTYRYSGTRKQIRVADEENDGSRTAPKSFA